MGRFVMTEAFDEAVVTDAIQPPSWASLGVPQAMRVNSGSLLSDGSVQSATYRQFHRSPGGFTQVRLAFLNGTGSAGPPAAITVKASVETGNFAADPTGATTACSPVTFGGLTSVTLAPGEIALSDVLLKTVAPGATFCTRTFVSVGTLGQRWPVAQQPLVAQYPAIVDYPWGYDASVDKTAGGATTSGVSPFSPYTASAILGLSATAKPCVAVIGDSIAQGTGEGTSANIPYGFPDWSVNAASFSYCRLAVSGLAANGWPASAIGTQALAFLQAIGCTHAISQLGINDLTGTPPTLVTMQGRLQAIWAALRGAGVGKVYQTTLTPASTSTDSWATLVNQTPYAAESIRVGVNNWIRTTPGGLDGFFEIADVCESARNSGKWVVDGTAFYATAEGIHPNGPLLTHPMGTAIPPATFTV